MNRGRGGYFGGGGGRNNDNGGYNNNGGNQQGYQGGNQQGGGGYQGGGNQGGRGGGGRGGGQQQHNQQQNRFQALDSPGHHGPLPGPPAGPVPAAAKDVRGIVNDDLVAELPRWTLSCYCHIRLGAINDLEGDVSFEEARWRQHQERASGMADFQVNSDFQKALLAKQRELANLRRAVAGGRPPSLGGARVVEPNSWVDQVRAMTAPSPVAPLGGAAAGNSGLFGGVRPAAPAAVPVGGLLFGGNKVAQAAPPQAAPPPPPPAPAAFFGGNAAGGGHFGAAPAAPQAAPPAPSSFWGQIPAAAPAPQAFFGQAAAAAAAPAPAPVTPPLQPFFAQPAPAAAAPKPFFGGMPTSAAPPQFGQAGGGSGAGAAQQSPFGTSPPPVAFSAPAAPAAAPAAGSAAAPAAPAARPATFFGAAGVVGAGGRGMLFGRPLPGAAGAGAGGGAPGPAAFSMAAGGGGGGALPPVAPLVPSGSGALTSEEVEAYRAQAFQHGRIPETPPPPELCC